MSENVFGQCATLIARAAIQKNLLAVPTPTEGDSGKALVANQDGSTEWDIRYFLMMNSSLCSSMQILLPELPMHPERF